MLLQRKLPKIYYHMEPENQNESNCNPHKEKQRENNAGEKQEWKTIACLTSATYSGRWNCENDKGKGTGSIKQ